MKQIMQIFAAALVLVSNGTYAGMNDNPVLASLKVELLEWREDDELVWDAEGWIGKDRDKLFFKTEGERSDSTTEEFETQALYDRAITPYWNVQAGWRGDWQPEQRRSWAAFGLRGLAPGFVETELTAFLADGRSAARLKLVWEGYLSQRFIIVPRLETNWYGDDDEVNGRGDGFSELELGLRLHYVIRPDILPYVGVAYTALYGDTGDYAEAEGERDRNLQVLAGLSFWF